MRTRTATSQFKGACVQRMIKSVQQRRAHISRSSRDVQPNQPGRPARLDLEDPAPTIAIEHHASGHLRLD
eukprot:scaffold8060_cov82-Phaeocystis_antarctica.AAC.3